MEGQMWTSYWTFGPYLQGERSADIKGEICWARQYALSGAFVITSVTTYTYITYNYKETEKGQKMLAERYRYSHI